MEEIKPVVVKPVVKKEAPRPVVKKATPVPVKEVKETPIVVEKKEEAKPNAVVVANSRTIKFVDASTGKPVQAEIELKTARGQKSIEADEQGVVSVSVEELRTGEAEIYAYGYFYKTEEVQKIAGTQTITCLLYTSPSPRD